MKSQLTSHTCKTPLSHSARSLLLGVALATATVAFPAQMFGREKVAGSKSDAVAAESDIQKQKSPRSRDESLKIGFAYLLNQQHSDGGWGQGGGWRNGKSGRVEGPNTEDPSDLGNTCSSLVAVLRSGETVDKSERQESIDKAFGFICDMVEKSDKDSLYVTSVRDTQLQVKIGSYVDTFLAGWALAELKGRTADDAAEKRRADALDKIVGKIEKNQKTDGSFEGNKGWASILSQGLSSRALNGASKSGAKVSDVALDNDQRQNLAGVDVQKGTFGKADAAEAPSAGIDLYRETAKLWSLKERQAANETKKTHVEKVLADPAAPKEQKDKARTQLEGIARDDKAANVAQSAVTGKLNDSRYTAGFGNNGGEEFLSYLNLGESLHATGGKAWTDWREKMHATLGSAQNKDGSWAGHHCITGRTFCTSTALLTLLLERTEAGVASNEQGGGSLKSALRK